jgi:hypothetical protein
MLSSAVLVPLLFKCLQDTQGKKGRSGAAVGAGAAAGGDIGVVAASTALTPSSKIAAQANGSDEEDSELENSSDDVRAMHPFHSGLDGVVVYTLFVTYFVQDYDSNVVDKSHEDFKRQKRQQMRREMMQKSIRGMDRPEVYVTVLASTCRCQRR